MNGVMPNLCVFLCVILVTTVSAQSPAKSFRWSVDAAKEDAVRAIESGELFLYSSGGLMCSPKADRNTEYLKLFPIETLACGCTNMKFNQARYARVFNNQILEYAARTPDIEEQLEQPLSGSLFSRMKTLAVGRNRKVAIRE